MIRFALNAGNRSARSWARRGAPLVAPLMLACARTSIPPGSSQQVSAEPPREGATDQHAHSAEQRTKPLDRYAARAWRPEHIELELNQICFDLQLPEDFKYDAFDFPDLEEDEELVVFLRGPRYKIAMGTELVYELERSFEAMKDHFAKQASNKEFVRVEETPFLWALVFAQGDTYTVMAWWPERRISCFANSLLTVSDADEVVDICWTAHHSPCTGVSHGQTRTAK